jgi:hypothetical protein
VHTPSSFDSPADGFEILIEFLVFLFFFGLLHVGSFLLLVTSVNMEIRRQWDMTEAIK